MSFYSGLEGGNALADILSGDVTPAGKLPFTIAQKSEDYPPFLHLGAKNKNIEYGYYHGYTLFDKKNIMRLFPKYQRRVYENLKIKKINLSKVVQLT